jgi:hypothetical protein
LVEIGSVVSEEKIFLKFQFWKGAIQGSFHKVLVAIGPVVSEEKIFM